MTQHPWTTATPAEKLAAIRAADVSGDPEDYAYGDEQAARDVAKRMDTDELAVVIEDLAGSQSAITAAMRNPSLSRWERQRLNTLLVHARTLQGLMDAELELAR